MKDETLIDPSQIKSTKGMYSSLYEQLEFGRFNSVKTGAAPVLFVEMQAADKQQVFSLPGGTFTIGDHSLMVFVNGQLQGEGSQRDYVEVDNRTVRFNHEDLTSYDVVTFRVAGGTSGPALHEIHTATAGQTIFNLASKYTVGNHSLQVFAGGIIQAIEIDYAETDSNTVTFLDNNMDEGDIVIFRVEGLPSIQSKYQSQITTVTYDTEGFLIQRETIGDSRIVEEFEYENGAPKRMITHEGGYIITKEYIWADNLCIGIHQTVREAV